MKKTVVMIAVFMAGVLLSHHGEAFDEVFVGGGWLNEILTPVRVEIEKPAIQKNSSGDDVLPVMDKDVIKALTGTGSSANSKFDFNSLNGNMPATWNDVVKMQTSLASAAASSAGSDNYESRRNYYDKQVLQTIESQMSLQPKRVIDAYGRSSKASAAALAMSEVSYNGLKSRLDKIQKAQDQIASTNDVKRAIDLTNQLVVHVAGLQAEILRVQTVQAGLLATTTDRDNQLSATRREFFGSSVPSIP